MSNPKSFQILIYNSLTRTVEPFVTHTPHQVKMYCCGPTVYGLLHVGNFRGAVFYNFMRNWLELCGYKVKFVYNFTDVDDKIIDQAKRQNMSPSELAEKYIQEFWTDYNSLKLRPHDVNPTVTESMDDIKSFIEGLIEVDKAYPAGGDVYYSVKSFPEYGKLSGRNTDELKNADPSQAITAKKDVLDFALWKSAKPDEPSWPSPWGQGRPGWHIECSAMIKKHLGEQIDIHGGGLDLLFPHHENEIAQSEGLTGKPFAKYWVHNNMIQFSGAKMSKSLGNIITLREFSQKYHPEIYKYLILSVHYRSVLDFSEDSISQTIKSLGKIYSSLSLAQEIFKSFDSGFNLDPTRGHFLTEKIKTLETQIYTDVNRDFNTALLLAHLLELVKSFNHKTKRGMKVAPEMAAAAQSFIETIKKWGSWMSLFQEDPDQFLINLDNHLLSEKSLTREQVQSKVAQRQEFRDKKDFAKADEVRKELEMWGILVSDIPNRPTHWEVAK